MQRVYNYVAVLLLFHYCFGYAFLLHGADPLSVEYKTDTSWADGYQGKITVKNNFNKPLFWKVSFDLDNGQTINLWNANSTNNKNHIEVAALNNALLNSQQETNFGFVVKGSGSSQPKNIQVKETSASSDSDPNTPKVPVGPIKEFKRILVGYFPNWFLYKKDHIPEFQAKDIQAQYLTHINYAFAKPYTSDGNGNVLSYKVSLTDPWADIQYPSGSATDIEGHIKQLQELKKTYPHLKVLISIGGWTIWKEGPPAGKFSKLSADPNLRKEFIDSAIELCEKYAFDGIDIDYEYPGFAANGGNAQPGVDKINYTKLLEELHDAARSKGLLLTIAAPAGPQHMANIEFDKIVKLVDWINLMAYDFHGAWVGSSEDLVTNHNAPLYAPKVGNPLFNVHSAVDAYLKAGVPSDKLVMGLALYGRSYAGVQSNSDGLYSSYKEAGPGTDENEPGMLMYYDIAQRMLSSYTRYWDNITKTPYLFNKETKIFISYDDKESLGQKIDYIKAKKMAGGMIWSLANASEQWDLVKYINEALEK